MRSVVSLRDTIEAFKRDDPGLSAEDVQFLDRLRSDDYAAKVDEAWSKIRKLPGWTANDEVRVIGRLVKALRVAKALPKVTAETAKSRSEIAAAKKAASVLRKYYAKHFGAEAANLLRGLAWAEKALESAELLCELDLSGDAGTTVALNREKLPPRISRKHKILAAQRNAFMLQVRQAMQDVFKRPCDAAIAALTTVAFKVDTDITDVQNARKWYIRRKV
jgi:hypothetical protein